jgi:hypothetical protein
MTSLASIASIGIDIAELQVQQVCARKKDYRGPIPIAPEPP